MMQTLKDSSQSQTIHRLIIALTLLGLAGCGVPDGILWLPDCSGVVYSLKDDAGIVQYDLKRRAKRVIVQGTETETPWPGMRADGKRLAVAKVETFYSKGSDNKNVRTQVKIYDLNGQLQITSKVNEQVSKLDNPSEKTESKVNQAALNWAGPSNKIIVFGEYTAIYDCVNNTWVSLVDILPLPFNNRPIRPDGVGFIAISDTGKSGRMCFVDWQGWISEFNPKLTMEGENSMIGAAWNGDVFNLFSRDDVIGYDTNKMTATRSRNPIDIVKSDGKLSAIHQFEGFDSQLCKFSKTVNDGTDTERQEWKLEIQQPVKNRRRVLFTSQQYSDFGIFFPSPDHKKVALDMKDLNSDKRTIIIINKDGNILANITAEKP